MRIDKWLWAARFYRTRSAATDAVLGGRVHVNGTRAKPAKDLHAGDEIELTVGVVRRVVEVLALSDKRGPATVAATLYRETPESIEARERAAAERKLASPPGAGGPKKRKPGDKIRDHAFHPDLVPGADLGARPTKLARRRLEALRRGQRRP